MAQQIITSLVDDIDGSEATETIELGWGGKVLELDLGPHNLKALDEALSTFVAAARVKGRMVLDGKARRSSGLQRTKPTRGETQEIRAWARAQGLVVSERGRLPESVLEGFEKAKARPTVEAKPAPVADPFTPAEAKVEPAAKAGAEALSALATYVDAVEEAEAKKASTRERKLAALANARAAKAAKAKAAAKPASDIEAGLKAMTDLSQAGVLPYSNEAIRVWAASQGVEVSARGKIGTSVRIAHTAWMQEHMPGV